MNANESPELNAEIRHGMLALAHSRAARSAFNGGTGEALDCDGGVVKIMLGSEAAKQMREAHDRPDSACGVSLPLDIAKMDAALERVGRAISERNKSLLPKDVYEKLMSRPV